MIERYYKVAIFILLTFIGQNKSTEVSFSNQEWSLHDLTSPIFLRHFDVQLSWVEAEALCQRHFGHLVRDGNGNEAIVHDFLTSKGVESEIWIGLHQPSPFERFHWVDDVTSVPLAPALLNRLDGTVEEGDLSSLSERNPSSQKRPLTDEEVEAMLEGREIDAMGLCVSVDTRAGSYQWRTRHCDERSQAQVLCQLPVPGWLIQGDCDLQSWIKSVKYPQEPEAIKVVEGGRLLEVLYSPHNDSARLVYECESGSTAAEDVLRTRECSFQAQSDSSGENVEGTRRFCEDAKLFSDSVVSGEPSGGEATIDQINGQQEGKIDSPADQQRNSYQVAPSATNSSPTNKMSFPEGGKREKMTEEKMEGETAAFEDEKSGSKLLRPKLITSPPLHRTSPLQTRKNIDRRKEAIFSAAAERRRPRQENSISIGNLRVKRDKKLPFPAPPPIKYLSPREEGAFFQPLVSASSNFEVPLRTSGNSASALYSAPPSNSYASPPQDHYGISGGDEVEDINLVYELDMLVSGSGEQADIIENEGDFIIASYVRLCTSAGGSSDESLSPFYCLPKDNTYAIETTFFRSRLVSASCAVDIPEMIEAGITKEALTCLPIEGMIPEVDPRARDRRCFQDLSNVGPQTWTIYRCVDRFSSLTLNPQTTMSLFCLRDGASPNDINANNPFGDLEELLCYMNDVMPEGSGSGSGGGSGEFEYEYEYYYVEDDDYGDNQAAYKPADGSLGSGNEGSSSGGENDNDDESNLTAFLERAIPRMCISEVGDDIGSVSFAEEACFAQVTAEDILNGMLSRLRKKSCLPMKNIDSENIGDVLSQIEDVLCLKEDDGGRNGALKSQSGRILLPETRLCYKNASSTEREERLCLAEEQTEENAPPLDLRGISNNFQLSETVCLPAGANSNGRRRRKRDTVEAFCITADDDDDDMDGSGEADELFAPPIVRKCLTGADDSISFTDRVCFREEDYLGDFDSDMITELYCLFDHINMDVSEVALTDVIFFTESVKCIAKEEEKEGESNLIWLLLSNEAILAGSELTIEPKLCLDLAHFDAEKAAFAKRPCLEGAQARTEAAKEFVETSYCLSDADDIEQVSGKSLVDIAEEIDEKVCFKPSEDETLDNPFDVVDSMAEIRECLSGEFEQNGNTSRNSLKERLCLPRSISNSMSNIPGNYEVAQCAMIPPEGSDYSAMNVIFTVELKCYKEDILDGIRSGPEDEAEEKESGPSISVRPVPSQPRLCQKEDDEFEVRTCIHEAVAFDASTAKEAGLEALRCVSRMISNGGVTTLVIGYAPTDTICFPKSSLPPPKSIDNFSEHLCFVDDQGLITARRNCFNGPEESREEAIEAGTEQLSCLPNRVDSISAIVPEDKLCLAEPRPPTDAVLVPIPPVVMPNLEVDLSGGDYEILDCLETVMKDGFSMMTSAKRFCLAKSSQIDVSQLKLEMVSCMKIGEEKKENRNCLVESPPESEQTELIRHFVCLATDEDGLGLSLKRRRCSVVSDLEVGAEQMIFLPCLAETEEGGTFQLEAMGNQLNLRQCFPEDLEEETALKLYKPQTLDEEPFKLTDAFVCLAATSSSGELGLMQKSCLLSGVSTDEDTDFLPCIKATSGEVLEISPDGSPLKLATCLAEAVVVATTTETNGNLMTLPADVGSELLENHLCLVTNEDGDGVLEGRMCLAFSDLELGATMSQFLPCLAVTDKDAVQVSSLASTMEIKQCFLEPLTTRISLSKRPSQSEHFNAACVTSENGATLAVGGKQCYSEDEPHPDGLAMFPCVKFDGNLEFQLLECEETKAADLEEVLETRECLPQGEMSGGDGSGVEFETRPCLNKEVSDSLSKIPDDYDTFRCVVEFGIALSRNLIFTEELVCSVNEIESGSGSGLENFEESSGGSGSAIGPRKTETDPDSDEGDELISDFTCLVGNDDGELQLQGRRCFSAGGLNLGDESPKEFLPCVRDTGDGDFVLDELQVKECQMDEIFPLNALMADFSRIGAPVPNVTRLNPGKHICLIAMPSEDDPTGKLGLEGKYCLDEFNTEVDSDNFEYLSCLSLDDDDDVESSGSGSGDEAANVLEIKQCLSNNLVEAPLMMDEEEGTEILSNFLCLTANDESDLTLKLRQCQSVENLQFGGKEETEILPCLEPSESETFSISSLGSKMHLRQCLAESDDSIEDLPATLQLPHAEDEHAVPSLLDEFLQPQVCLASMEDSSDIGLVSRKCQVSNEDGDIFASTEINYLSCFGGRIEDDSVSIPFEGTVFSIQKCLSTETDEEMGSGAMNDNFRILDVDDEDGELIRDFYCLESVGDSAILLSEKRCLVRPGVEIGSQETETFSCLETAVGDGGDMIPMLGSPLTERECLEEEREVIEGSDKVPLTSYSVSVDVEGESSSGDQERVQSEEEEEEDMDVIDNHLCFLDSGDVVQRKCFKVDGMPDEVDNIEEESEIISGCLRTNASDPEDLDYSAIAPERVRCLIEGEGSGHEDGDELDTEASQISPRTALQTTIESAFEMTKNNEMTVEEASEMVVKDIMEMMKKMETKSKEDSMDLMMNEIMDDIMTESETAADERRKTFLNSLFKRINSRVGSNSFGRRKRLSKTGKSNNLHMMGEALPKVLQAFFRIH